MIDHTFTGDRRDWNGMRERITELEAENRRLRSEMALFQEGVKERLDVFSVLLAGLESALARKDVE